MKVVAVLVVALALVIGIASQFTHCKAGATMGAAMGATTSAASATTGASAVATAKATPMRCYWTARAELSVALPLLAGGVLFFFSRRKETRRALAVLVCALGAVAMLLPTVLIGVCEQSSAVCNTTMRPILLAAGGLTVAIGLITLIRNELSDESPMDGLPTAVQATS